MILIKVKTSFEGIHKWPNAPKEVGFLKYPHRHLFNVIVKVQVRDNDREIEYFMFKRYLNSLIKEMPKTLGESSSCEQMAEFLLDYIELDYDKHFIEVEVNEDGENGSIVNNQERFNS